jgi:uncharacterized membrane protein YeaQ/YmgE (transglycosylase-associated protein family)
VGILSYIIVGLVAGWLAGRITGRRHRLLANMIVGIVGALIGAFVFTSVFGFRYDPGINLASVAVATVGSVLFLSFFSSTGRHQLPGRHQPWR